MPTIDGRATSTMSTFRLRSCWWSLKHSRSKRLARFRITAPPIFPAVIMPTLERLASGRCCQLIIRQPITIRCPCWRNRKKSRPCFMRSARLNLSRRVACAAISARVIRESNACGRPDGGSPKWLCHSCSSCGSENHVAVCGVSWTVDIVVSYLFSFQPAKTCF